MTRYEHTQVGYVIIWSLLIGAILVAISATFELGPNLEMSLVGSMVLLITLALFYKLTISIDDKSLRAALGIGVIKKRVPIAEIAGCEPIRIRWWYGWGIHLTPYGWLYNVSGLDAVAITLRNGRKLTLGSDDSQRLVGAIRNLIDKRG